MALTGHAPPPGPVPLCCASMSMQNRSWAKDISKTQFLQAPLKPPSVQLPALTMMAPGTPA